MSQYIELFLESPAFAVLGATSNRNKYGNKVLRCYMQHKKTVYPVNPHEQMIEGLKVISSIKELSKDVKSISIITPPPITEGLVNEAIAKGIENIWMQPGAESEAAIELCVKNNINVIAQGPCLLVVLGYSEE